MFRHTTDFQHLDYDTVVYEFSYPSAIGGGWGVVVLHEGKKVLSTDASAVPPLVEGYLSYGTQGIPQPPIPDWANDGWLVIRDIGKFIGSLGSLLKINLLGAANTDQQEDVVLYVDPNTHKFYLHYYYGLAEHGQPDVSLEFDATLGASASDVEIRLRQNKMVCIIDGETQEAAIDSSCAGARRFKLRYYTGWRLEYHDFMIVYQDVFSESLPNRVMRDGIALRGVDTYWFDQAGVTPDVYVTDSEGDIDVSNIPNGTYWVGMRDKYGNTFFTQFVVDNQ